MYDVAFRDEAVGWARELVTRESRGPGDTENAMRRLEARYGISFGTFWALRYRAPRDILVSVYFRLRDAYDDARDRQLKALQHDIAIAKASRPDSHSVRAAEAMVERAVQSALIPRSDGGGAS